MKSITANEKVIRILLVGPELSQKGGMASVQKLILKYTDKSLRFKHIATHDEGSILHRFQVFIKALTHFIWTLQRREIDLVHIHVSEKGSVLRKLVLLIIAKSYKRPVLMHAHGCEFHVFHDKLPRNIKFVVDSALRQADCLMALSQSWKQYYVSQCGLDYSKVIVFPNPVEIPDVACHYHDIGNTDTLNFVFLGRISARKGTFALIQAFAAMRNIENSRLFIAGDGEIEEANALIDSLKLKDSVHLLGWIDEVQCRELLRKSHIFVLPSHNEGVPMAMLEAMAEGLPIITTPVGGIPEFVTDGESGYLVPPGHIDSLIQAMDKLVEDSSLRLSMGQASRERVLSLDLRIYHQKLKQLYCSFLRKTSLPKDSMLSSEMPPRQLHSLQKSDVREFR